MSNGLRMGVARRRLVGDVFAFRLVHGAVACP